MAKFTFRLQKVLEYRAVLEEQAKDAYLDAKASRLEAEAVVQMVADRRKMLLSADYENIQERLSLQEMMWALDDQERQQKIIIDILIQDEEARRLEWVEKKQELETLEKLRTKEYEAWQLDENRKEQAALDEWAVTRKPA